MTRIGLRHWLSHDMRSPRRGLQVASSGRQRCRLLLEPLEGRWVPTTVTNLADSGAGSLRQAILDTPAGGTVDFQPDLAGTIALTTAELTVAKNLTISGPGAEVITVSGINARRVFTITASSTVTLSGLTIADGRVSGTAVAGGGIVNSGTLSLIACTVRDNSVFSSTTLNASAIGGGIRSVGTLFITNSVVANNSAEARSTGPGAVARGGGISHTGAVTITNSVVSNNSASAFLGINATALGGGIAGDTTGGKLTIIDSTFSHNSAVADGRSQAVSQGGGIYSPTATLINCTVSNNRAENQGLPVGTKSATGGGIQSATGTVTLTGVTITENAVIGVAGTMTGGGISGRAALLNTIVAGNTAASAPDLSGTLTSSSHNLIGNTQGGSGFQGRDLLNVDPLLGPLQDNGGPTPTHALLPGSPALDRGHPKTDPTGFDQRGLGFARVVGGRVDIGAFEVQGNGYGRTPWALTPLVEAEVIAGLLLVSRNTQPTQPVLVGEVSVSELASPRTDWK